MGIPCDDKTAAQHAAAENEFIFRREKALDELSERFAAGSSFVLHGPSGVGKTFLLRHATRDLSHVLYCSNSSTGQSVFSVLALELLRVKNRRAHQFLRNERVIRDKSTISLRGIVFDALNEGDYWIVLDHLRAPAAGLSADIRDIIVCRQTPVVLVARTAYMDDLGFLAPVFVLRDDQMRLTGFSRSATLEFARIVAQKTRLSAANLQESLEQIVQFSRGAPGAVVTMLQMALRPKYRTGEHIKTSPLYIDFLLSWHRANAL